jgi:hypothetical protein
MMQIGAIDRDEWKLAVGLKRWGRDMKMRESSIACSKTLAAGEASLPNNHIV